MRCRLCLTELPQGQIVCPICGLDNSSYYQEEVKKEVENKETTPNNIQNPQTPSVELKQEPTITHTIPNQEQVNIPTNQSVVTNKVADPVQQETNMLKENVSVTMPGNHSNSITGQVNQPIMTETVAQEKNVTQTIPTPSVEPQEQIAATPLQTNTETVSTPTTETNIITPIPEMNSAPSQPLPNTSSNQATTIPAPNMIMPNNQSVTNSNTVEQAPIQKKTNSMLFHNVFMFLTGFSILISLITAFLFQFNTTTITPIVYSGIMLFGLFTRANYGRILAMIQSIMTTILGVIITIIEAFAAPLILGIVQSLNITFIPASIVCILGIAIFIYGICVFVYYKKRKGLFH